MTTTRTSRFAAAAAAAALFVSTGAAFAHCQIPCGIYGDAGRFDTMEEHIRTIEKSMQQIQALSAEDAPDMNQLVRWVQNKEVHADALSRIVHEYFLAQRIKPDEADRDAYLAKLEVLHDLIVLSMKAKQTTDLAHVAGLRDALHAFQHAYMGDAGEPK